ncbi:DNA-binding transcriptional regulator [Lentisphaera araneosa]|nr:DNA-binding transcriptional regulator [Lentisphaera araneosa]
MKRVALAFPIGVDHLTEVLYGIRNHPCAANWQFLTNPERHRLEIRDLKNWDGDGIIAQINSQEEAELIQSLGIPCINISGVLKKSPVPRVCADYEEIGKKAAEFFLKKGFRNFAYYGIKKVWYSAEVYRGFRNLVADHGYEVDLYEAHSGVSTEWQQSNDGLESFLRTLAPKTALLAAHDPRAVEVLQTCARIGIKVPEQISVMGENNDKVNCELATPTLSSVARQGRKLGHKVAELLHSFMNGESVAGDHVIPCGEIFERDSTAVLSIYNPEIAKVVEFIRLNVLQQINVESAASHIGRSRRWLEYHFKEELQQTPLEFISSVRAEKAKELLELDASLRITEAAYKLGFSSTNQLNKYLKKFYGMSAKEIRQKVK